MNTIRAAEATAQKLPNSEYVTADLSDELSREIVLPTMRWVISEPKTLIIRKGGKTHRVVDAAGTVHCYAAPETGNSVVLWIPRNPSNPVQF